MNQDLKDISDKLDVLKGIVETHITATNIYRESQTAKIDEHHRDLNGNGNPGVKTKIDRLERSENVKNWMTGVIFTTLATIVLNYFFKFFSEK